MSKTIILPLQGGSPPIEQGIVDLTVAESATRPYTDTDARVGSLAIMHGTAEADSQPTEVKVAYHHYFGALTMTEVEILAAAGHTGDIVQLYGNDDVPEPVKLQAEADFRALPSDEMMKLVGTLAVGVVKSADRRRSAGSLQTLALAFHNASVAEATERENASIDPLTGLSNRRGLEREFEGVVGEAIRHGGQIVAMLSDVDDFKSVNDVHGHATGDQLLVAKAAFMRSVSRDRDLAARLGGDEGVMIMPQGKHEVPLTLRKAQQRVANIQAAWAKYAAETYVETPSGPVLIKDLSKDIGITIGWSIVEPKPEDARDPKQLLDNLLAIADDRLMLEKQRKNRPGARQRL